MSRIVVAPRPDQLSVVTTIKYLFLALRPKQWTKNFMLFFGLIFALKLKDPGMVALAVAAFVVFCLLSSGIYLINDLVDLENDRKHPLKCRRPLASGNLSATVAVVAALLLLGTMIPAGLALNRNFGLAAIAYVVLMFAYSFSLKHIVLVDVFAIAAGFVLRAVGGALVIDVPISPWLYVCTVLGALFLGLSKRRHELILLNDDATSHRKILDEYSPAMLDQMITIVTATTVMAYSLYTFSAENLPKNHAMMLTIPFVLYGTFRYLYLIHLKNAGGNPEEILIKDKPLIMDISLWLATAVAVLYVFR